MYTLDANIFVRDADPADPLHDVCRKLLAVLDQRRVNIVVPNLVLAEVAATIRSNPARPNPRARTPAEALSELE